MIIGALYLLPKISVPTKLVNIFRQSPGFYKVSQVIDGDTIVVDMDGIEERVRLIGIDTPETLKPDSPTECFGKAASEFANQLVNNKAVRLAADPINTNRDRYNRLLRYVFLEDGTFVNAEIIKQGYGFAYLSFPFTKAEEFRAYQVEARQAERGLWAGVCEVSDLSGRLKTNRLP